MRFADTNVLLYSISTAPLEAAKMRIARQLLESQDIALSVQVLQEFYVQATRQSRADRLSHEQASALVEAFTRYPVQETTLALVRAALETGRRFQISYWDAAVVEAARLQGCDVILSEDLGNGASYNGVVVTNPFKA